MNATGSIDPIDVTVVIPTLGTRGGLLERAAKSTLGHHLIIVDDGTPDDSVVEVAGKFGARLLRRDANGGVAAAQNTGLDAVETTWVLFLHTDDQLAPFGGLHGATSYIAAFQSRRAYPPGGDVPTAEDLLLHRIGTHISHYVLRTDVARELRFDEGLRSWEDWDFIYRLLGTGLEIVAVEPPFVEVGSDAPDRLSAGPAMLDGIVYLYDKYELALRGNRRARSAWEFKIARGFARSGDWRCSIRWLLKSTMTEPWHPRRCFAVSRLILRPQRFGS